MSDRTLGYAVLLFLAVFITIPLIYLLSILFAPRYQRTIVFEQVASVNFLKYQDPVRIRGVEAGLIRAINLDSGNSIVVISTKQPLHIHQGYSISAESKGFMGDRYVEIDPGDVRLPEIDPKAPLHGGFLLGPADLLPYCGELVTKVNDLALTVREFKDGSAGKPSFTARFKRTVNNLDSVTASMGKVLSSVNRLLGNRMDSLAGMVGKARTLSIDLDTTLPATEKKFDAVVRKVQRLLVDADTLVAAGDRLIIRYKSKEAATLNEKFLVLRRQMTSLRDFVNDLKENGLELPVELR
jgi:ABC-type transporter Mla subunit MlaD